MTDDTSPPVTIPAAPTGVQCLNGFAGPLVLWTDNSNNETGFRIFQQTETAPLLIATEPANSGGHNLVETGCEDAPSGVASYNSVGQSAITWQSN